MRLKVIARLYRRALKDPGLGLSSTNSFSISIAQRSLLLLASCLKYTLDRESVFVDVGCGAGLPSIYMSLIHGVRSYGIDHVRSCIDVANSGRDVVDVAPYSHKDVGLDERQCAFSVTAVRELTVDWFLKRQVTHVYTFDAAFSAEDTLYLADIVASADTVRFEFVCSCFDSCWTRWGFVVVKRLTIAMSGGEGSRTMYVLARNDQDLINDHDQVFLICACVLSKSIIFIHIRVCVSVGCCPYS